MSRMCARKSSSRAWKPGSRSRSSPRPCDLTPPCERSSRGGGPSDENSMVEGPSTGAGPLHHTVFAAWFPSPSLRDGEELDIVPEKLLAGEEKGLRPSVDHVRE